MNTKSLKYVFPYHLIVSPSLCAFNAEPLRGHGDGEKYEMREKMIAFSHENIALPRETLHSFTKALKYITKFFKCIFVPPHIISITYILQANTEFLIPFEFFRKLLFRSSVAFRGSISTNHLMSVAKICGC